MIEDDLTWEERKTKWLFSEAVMRKERRGVRVWIGNGRTMIEKE